MKTEYVASRIIRGVRLFYVSHTSQADAEIPLDTIERGVLLPGQEARILSSGEKCLVYRAPVEVRTDDVITVRMGDGSNREVRRDDLDFWCLYQPN